MGIVSDYKDVYEVFKSLGNFEYQQKIIELREGHLKLREEKLRLEEENQDLRARLEKSTALTFESPYYWNLGADGAKDGPFCQVCQDSSDKLIRLHEAIRTRGWWDCKVCSQHFTDKNYVAPDYSSRSRGGSWMGV